MTNVKLLALVYALVAIAITSAKAQTATEVVLHNFAREEGANVYAGVIRDSAGNLYGTAYNGGPAYAGAVYKLDPAGNYTVLYSFTGGADGKWPSAGVIRDPAGNLYGTTQQGGAASAGVVYKIDTAGRETVLYNFTDNADGGHPYAGVIRDAAGNLYGTTESGGTQNYAGVVYKLDPAGHETVLHTFMGDDYGGNPYAGVVRDSAGNLYGTTLQGGTVGMGVVYKLDTTGHETVLHTFTGQAGGGSPSGVILDPAGNLYGTATLGGAYRQGLVFKLDTAGSYSVLYSFTGTAEYGSGPSGVILDPAGNLYGTTKSDGPANGGAVYKLDTAGNYTVLYGFPELADGRGPEAGVILDPAGNFYGTAVYGGPTKGGVVYKLDAAGQETLLHSFPTWALGIDPGTGVIRDSDGTLYGTTAFGGTGGYLPNDILPAHGTVYKLEAAGHYLVLHTFSGTDGSDPWASPVRDTAGNLYGVTAYGGNTTCTTYPAGCGVVYKVDAAGNFSVLYNFPGGADGALPTGLTLDPAGNFYGTAKLGGVAGGCDGTDFNGCGLVYKLDAAGHETVLHTFTGGADGALPDSGVIRDAAGNLYGTASSGGAGNAGVVYQIDTAGSYSVLYSFTGGAGGGGPIAGVIRDQSGNLYGTASGGTGGHGVVYKLDAAGNYTVLYSFTSGNGTGVANGLTLDPAGNLYGTTSSGGTTDWGVVYELDTAGNFTVLHSFTGGTDGGQPFAGVIRDSSGSLYGTTYYGGERGTGVVFKLM